MHNFVRKNVVDISRYLPKYLSKDEVYDKLLKAISSNQEDARKKIQALLEQMFVLTADECLDDWEIFLGIKIDHSILTRDRRQRILRKIQGTQPVTVEFLTNVINQYISDQAATIEEQNSNYAIEILYHGGQITDYKALRNAIRTYLPAHIGYKLITITNGNEEIYEGGIVQCFNVTSVDSALGYALGIDNTNIYHGGTVLHVYKKIIVKGDATE